MSSLTHTRLAVQRILEEVDKLRYNLYIYLTVLIGRFVQKESRMQPVRESIRPSADLRNHYNEISRQCREGREAVIITVNGRGDTVSLNYDEYRRLIARLELLELLAEAEEDVIKGRTAPIQATFDNIRMMLKGE